MNKKDSYFRIIVYLFCLTLLPFDLLTFITGTPSAKAEDALIEYNLQQSNQVINTKSSDDIRSQLWLADITSAQEDKNDENELELLIEKIRAVELAPQELSPEKVEVSEQIIINEQNDGEIESIELKREDVNEIESEIPFFSIKHNV